MKETPTLTTQGACVCGNNDFVLVQEVTSPAFIKDGRLLQAPSSNSEVKYAQCDKCGRCYYGEAVIGKIKLNAVAL